MSNIINKIRLSGTDYTLSATTSGGVTSGEVETMISAATSGYTARFAEDEEVTARALNELNDAISGKVDTSTFDTYSGNVETALSGKASESDLNTLSGTVTGHTADTTIHVTSSDKATWNAKSDFSGSYNDLTNKLSAGTNITIVDNVISAEGGSGGKAVSGGTNISITTGETADTINCTLPITANTSVRKNDIAIGNDIIGVGDYRRIIIGNGNKNKYGNGRTTDSILICTPSKTSNIYNVVNAANCIGIGGDGLEVGYDNISGYGSIAIGYGSKSIINKSLAIGHNTVASGTTQTNINNQIKIDTSNQVYIYNKDNTEMICLQDQLGGSSITVDTSLDSGSTNPVANSAITNAINAKQDTLSAGTGIDITNNVISATGGGGGGIDSGTVQTMIDESISGKQDTLSAGTGIDITNNVISATGGGGGEGKAVEAGRGIDVASGESAYTVSFNLPISAGTGTNALVVGGSTTASGNNSFAGGDDAIASGNWSFAFGRGQALNNYTFAANGFSKAKKSFSAAFNNSEANNTYAFSTGAGTKANGYSSFVSGWYANANNDYEASFGYYNNSVSASTTFGDSGNTLFSVGNGTADNARHNAFEIRQNGDIYCSDGTNDVKLQDTITATAANTTALGGLSIVKLTQSEYDALATKDNSTLYVIVN